jgi:hypothetical protein
MTEEEHEVELNEEDVGDEYGTEEALDVGQTANGQTGNWMRDLLAEMRRRSSDRPTAASVIPSYSGLDLEGNGMQVDHGIGYPNIVPVNDSLEFKEEVIDVMTRWRKEVKPFRPRDWSTANLHARIKKFQWLVDMLSDIYNIPAPRVNIGEFSEQSWNSAGSSGSSNYNKLTHAITLHGKPSVTTLLHEFGHARCFDEMDACIWSVNLFRKIFPKSYGRLTQKGHVLLKEAKKN